ncbi:MAG TPA: agmatinase [Thermodesulfovibrionales bacterium]|nr:agmatinase [Thermodesulfovibrionales bacterium]
MSEEPPFNFCGLADEFTTIGNSAIVMLPVPFDETSTWIKGADKGPDAIIEASRHLELYDRETDTEVYRKGIFTDRAIVTAGSEPMIEEVFRRTSELLQQEKFVVTVGGEHSISIGAVRAHAALHEKMAVLHLDAHADLRDTYEGSRYNHACTVARIQETVETVISVGIRSMDSSERTKLDEKRVFYADYIHGANGWIGEVLAVLPRRVYVTIDLDVFDPGIMPSTGTPEPGGLDWYQVLRLLRTVSQEKVITGFDVVELCPSADRAPDFLAAKLIYKLLSYSFA